MANLSLTFLKSDKYPGKKHTNIMNKNLEIVEAR